MKKPKLEKLAERAGALRKIRRLFFDIETSPNVVFSWSTGYKLTIPYGNILKERAIICICWKWAHEKSVSSLSWDKGDDKKILSEFAKVIDSADEVIGQNSDNFDIKWLRTRALFHGIRLSPIMTTQDTYKMAKRGFRFNSNRLDYMGEFMGLGKKIKTDFNLWKSIVLDNDEGAMAKMIRYCKRDVVMVEQIFQRMEPYLPHKTHAGVIQGGVKSDCPRCASQKVERVRSMVTATGTPSHLMLCQDCGFKYKVSARELFRREQAKWAERETKEAD